MEVIWALNMCREVVATFGTVTVTNSVTNVSIRLPIPNYSSEAHTHIYTATGQILSHYI